MNKPNNPAAIEELIAELAGAPHTDHLPDLTFAEAMQVPFFNKLIRLAITGERPAADHDEEFIRAEIARLRLDGLALHLKLIQSHRSGGPVLAPWAHRDLDPLSAEILQDFAIFGIIAYINRCATHELHSTSVAA